jgi:hypothetical protein
MIERTMIHKRLSETTEDDLLALINNGVSEGRTIDYKRDLPGGSDSDKKEFLADVSSFANTSGGDIVFGMAEENGLPTAIVGIQATDVDFQIRRLDSILAAGVSPRIRHEIRAIQTGNGLRMLVIRVERSWSGPHRVVFQNHDKFFGRNSAGKYPLDVNELRSAFNLSGLVTERIRSFRTDRIIALNNNETPLPFTEDPKVVLHCIPLASFSDQAKYDVLPFYENPTRLLPLGTTAWDRRINLDGVILFGSHQPCHTYTQIYRTGVIEVVNGRILANEYQGHLVIPSIAYERYVFEYLPQCFRVLQEIGCTAPVVVALTLIKTRGLIMGTERLRFEYDFNYPIVQDTIVLPETVVEDLSTPVGKILKPLFDLVWNACGYPSSENFDAEGNWIGRR